MHPSTLYTTLLLLLSTTILAAPVAVNKGAVRDGTTHFARSVPEILAEKAAAEKRAERGREKGREMGLW